jgi:predicted anti-sigma-YlaC factor YlaD
MSAHLGEDLFDLAQGSVPEARARELFVHLETCESCRAQLDEAKRVLSALDAPAIEPSPFFDRKVFQRLDELDRESARPWYERLISRIPAPALAAPAIAAALAAIVLWPKDPKEPTVDPNGPKPEDDEARTFAEVDPELLEDLELFQNFSTVENLDVLDDLDVIVEMEDAG